MAVQLDFGFDELPPVPMAMAEAARPPPATQSPLPPAAAVDRQND